MPASPAAVNHARRVVALQALAQVSALLRPHGRKDWTVVRTIRAMDATGYGADVERACRLMREAVRIAARLPAIGVVAEP